MRADIPAIKPEDVDIEATHYSRSVHVRLPAGVTAQMLHDHPRSLWSEVQRSRMKGLRRFDTVRFIAHDESFLIDCAIVISTHDGVRLDFKRIVPLKDLKGRAI